MKRTLIALFVFAITVSQAFAQCIPNPAYANASFGVWPDSLPFIQNSFACGGQDYTAIMDVKTLTDTIVYINPPLGSNVTIWFDAWKVVASGLPSGFTVNSAGPTYFGGPQNGYWENIYGTPGNLATLQPVQGCFSITANPAYTSLAAPPAGYLDYPFTVNFDGRIAATSPDISFVVPNGSWLSSLGAFGFGAIEYQYTLRVYASSSCPSGPAQPCLATITPSITGLASSYLLNDGNAALSGLPTNGLFFGPGISANEFDPSVAGVGNHTVVYSFIDGNGCLGSVGQCVEVTLQVDGGDGVQLTESDGVSIYPNPGNGLYTLSFRDAKGSVRIEVTDVRGRNVHTSFATSNGKLLMHPIDLTEFSSGVYTLSVQVSGRTRTMKLVKE